MQVSTFYGRDRATTQFGDLTLWYLQVPDRKRQCPTSHNHRQLPSTFQTIFTAYLAKSIGLSLPETTLTESWYTPPCTPPEEAGELLPAVQVAAGVQTFVGVYVAEAVRRIVETWTAEVTAELVVAIGAAPLVEAVVDEPETVYQLSAIRVFFTFLPKIMFDQPHASQFCWKRWRERQVNSPTKRPPL
jgi:hypothetical protein